MTREDVINNIMNTLHTFDYEVEEIINEIFDDFESKTCENCKHYDKYHSKCLNQYSIAYKAYSNIVSSDGCNKFEAK